MMYHIKTFGYMLVPLLYFVVVLLVGVSIGFNQGIGDGKRKQLEQDKYLYEKCYNYVDMWSK